MGDPAAGRILVQAGKWLVPVEERPANWRLILDEPTCKEYLQVQPAGPQPVTEPAKEIQLSEKIGQLESPLDAAIAETERRERRASEPKRERITPLRFLRFYMRELYGVVEESGKAFGADGWILTAGHILVMGLGCRDSVRIANKLSASLSRVRKIGQRYRSGGVWLPNGTVRLGDLDKFGDLPLWLIATAGAGEIDFGGYDSQGEILFRSREVPQ
jgi:hypothetical protein